MKEWTMGAPLCAFSMTENGEGFCSSLPQCRKWQTALITFSMKEWTVGAPLFTFSMKEQAAGSAHHFLNEGKGDVFHSSLSQ